MNRQQFLGTYYPQRTWLHRVPPALKFGVLAALGVLILVFRSPYVNAGILAVAVVVATSARMPVRLQWASVRRLWLILIVFVAVNLWLTDVYTAARVLTAITALVFAANLFVLTTRLEELLRLVTQLATPLKYVGLRPYLVGLAVMIMVRSLSVLADLVQETGQSAAARGLQNNVRARTMPVVLGAVSHALATGEALAARGLVDDEGDDEETLTARGRTEDETE